jgi:hypothetical protein
MAIYSCLFCVHIIHNLRRPFILKSPEKEIVPENQNELAALVLLKVEEAGKDEGWSKLKIRPDRRHNNLIN